MAKSSILREVVIDGPENVRKFIEALEKAEELSKKRDLLEEEQLVIDWINNSLLKDRVNLKRRRSKRRHNRKRVIEKRRKMVEERYIWNSGGMQGFDNFYLKEPGRMSKDNLTCSCWMCKWEKHNKIEKPKYKERSEDYEQYL